MDPPGGAVQLLALAAQAHIGSFASASIVLARRTSVAVPAAAIAQTGSGESVLVVHEPDLQCRFEPAADVVLGLAGPLHQVGVTGPRLAVIAALHGLFIEHALQCLNQFHGFLRYASDGSQEDWDDQLSDHRVVG